MVNLLKKYIAVFIFVKKKRKVTIDNLNRYVLINILFLGT